MWLALVSRSVGMRFLYPFDFTEHKLAAMKGFTVDHLILMIDFYKNRGDDLKYLTAIYIDNNSKYLCTKK